MQLDVLEAWLPALPPHSRSLVFRIMTDLMLLGSVGMRHVQRVYEICSRISRKSSADEAAHQTWMQQLHTRSENYILKQMKSMTIPSLCNAQLIGFMAVYSETVADIKVANEQVVDGIFQYLDNVTAVGKGLGMFVAEMMRVFFTFSLFFPPSVAKDSSLEGKVNCSQIIITKFALFNYEIAMRAVPIIGNLVHKIDQIGIIKTAIICLKDLCKK